MRRALWSLGSVMHVHRASAHENAPMAREVVLYSNFLISERRSEWALGCDLCGVGWGLVVGALMRLMGLLRTRAVGESTVLFWSMIDAAFASPMSL